MRDTDRFPARKSPRIFSYDYATPNYYFVTICTHHKQCLFGLPNNLNYYGRIAEGSLQRIAEHFCGVRVEKAVVMPNHVHMILVLDQGTSSLPTIIGQYKSFVTKQIHQYAPKRKVWQVSFHDHIIRNQRSYEKIWSYIDNNPAKWIEDCFYTASSISNDYSNPYDAAGS